MRLKRAGLLTKLVIVVLLVYLATSLLDLRGQIQSVQEERDTLEQQVEEQRLANQQLEDAIENPGPRLCTARLEGEIYKEDISVSDGVWCWVHFGR